MALPDNPDKSMISKILSDVNLTEKDLDIAVSAIKQWLMKQPHLPPAATDDCLLKSYIIGCKSVERAKEKLDNYFTYRMAFNCPFFVDRDPVKLNWKSCQKFMVLPGMTEEGYKILFATLPTPDKTPDFSLVESCRTTLMIMDDYCKNYYMSSGVIFVNDLANLSIDISLKCSIAVTAAVSKIIQDGFPFRIKKYITFNAPGIADTFVNTFAKPFFNKKLKSRLYVYSEDHTVVKNHFPVELLPSDYTGGKNPSTETLWSNTKMNLEKERDWYLSYGSQSVNENLRLKDSDQMKGTFRKLEID